MGFFCTFYFCCIFDADYSYGVDAYWTVKILAVHRVEMATTEKAKETKKIQTGNNSTSQVTDPLASSTGITTSRDKLPTSHSNINT